MLKNLLKAFVVLLLFNAFAVAGIVAYYHVRYQAEYETARKFETLRPGMPLHEAQAIVGKAVRVETVQNGKYEIHIYASPPFMAEPLRLKVRVQDNLVEEIGIGERKEKKQEKTH